MLAVETRKEGNWENERKRKSKIPVNLGKDFSTVMKAENKKAEKLRRTGICPGSAVLLGSGAVLCTIQTVWGRRAGTEKNWWEGKQITQNHLKTRDLQLLGFSVWNEGKKLSPRRESCSWNMSEQHICLLMWAAHHLSCDAATKAQISATGLLAEQ